MIGIPALQRVIVLFQAVVVDEKWRIKYSFFVKEQIVGMNKLIAFAKCYVLCSELDAVKTDDD
jgi:hypothetical protein